MTDFYRVMVQVGTEGCKTCGHGRYWTVVYVDGDGEETEIGTSWADEETAQDVCDLMNMAYDAGCEALATRHGSARAIGECERAGGHDFGPTPDPDGTRCLKGCGAVYQL